MSRRLRTRVQRSAHGWQLHHSNPHQTVANNGPLAHQQLPPSIMPFLAHSTLSFSGTSEDLDSQFQALQGHQLQEVKVISIAIEGDRVQQENTLMVQLTLLIGAILIIPLLLLISNWFKRKFRQLFSTRSTTYELLYLIVNSCPRLQKANFFLQDNFVQGQKLSRIVGVRESVKVSIVNVAQKISIEGSGFRAFRMFFEEYQGLAEVSGVWGDYKVVVEGDKTMPEFETEDTL